jgi:hypothetical protein
VRRSECHDGANDAEVVAMFSPARRPVRRCVRAAALASVLLSPPWLAAQAPVLPPSIPTNALPPGFAAARSLLDTVQPLAFRRLAALDHKRVAVAIRGALHLAGEHFPPPGAAPCFEFVGDDVAFLVPRGTTLVVGSLRGKVAVLDAASGALRDEFTGVANCFSATPLPNGELLAAANPLWPAPGAHGGIWQLGPNRAPRQLLQLVGPSAPLCLLTNGDLVVAELGTVLPPPPGAARLLRFPAATIAAALAGGTLTTADATAIGTGFAGIYDLVEDDVGRLLVSEPASSTIVHTAVGQLQPVGTFCDLGPQRFATGLQFVAGTAAPFAAGQPAAHAPKLLVATSDYASWFELVAVAPARPRLTSLAGHSLPPGTHTLTLDGAAPHGFVLFAVGLPTHAAEVPLPGFGPHPLWLGLDPAAAIALGIAAIDGQGRANHALAHAPGATHRIDAQAFAFTAAAVPFGSSNLLPLILLP